MASLFLPKPLKSRNPIPDADPLRAVRPLAARNLLSAPMRARLEDLPDAGMKYFELSLGAEDSNFINGMLKQRDGKLVLEIEYFYVALRGFGIGGRLLRAFAAGAKDNGALEIWGGQVTNDALALRRKVFGEGALQFYEKNEDGITVLPMSFEEVRLSNVLIDANNRHIDAARTYDDDADEITHIGVYVDLAEIDTSSWERPAHTEYGDLYSLD